MMYSEIEIPCEVTHRYVYNIVYKAKTMGIDCYIRFKDRQVYAQSVLGILSLDLHKGDKVEVIAYTEDPVDLAGLFTIE